MMMHDDDRAAPGGSDRHHQQDAAAAVVGGGGDGGRAAWLSRMLKLSMGGSAAGTLVLAYRAYLRQARVDSLATATPVEVGQLERWFEGQQRVLDSSLSHMSGQLPPQYLALTGRSSCAQPITTEFSQPPQQAIWYSRLQTKTFLRLFPFTRLRMLEEQRETAFFETRSFELEPLLLPPNTPVPAPIISDSTALTAAASAASSLPASLPTAPPCVSVPSSLPADASYFRGLLRQVSDSIRESSLSSSDFMKQMAEGRLQIKERNVERIVPIAQPTTVIGWVYRDRQTGRMSVLSGPQRSATEGAGVPTTEALLLSGGTHAIIQSEGAAPVDAASSASSTVTSLHLQPDLQAYSYSEHSHPCIISSKSPARILEDERASVSSARKWLIFSAGVTVVIGLVIAGRYFYRSYLRSQELQRLLEFHAGRKARREQKHREKKEKERRRQLKLKQQQQLKELAMLKEAQAAYFNAAAAAAAFAPTSSSSASSSSQRAEGAPHPLLSGRSSPSPRPLRQGSSPLPLHPLASSSAASSASSYASSPFPLPMPMVARTSSPDPAALLVAVEAARRQVSASASSHPALAYSGLDVDGSGSSDGHASDDEASHTSDDATSSDEERADHACIICAENKADACLLPCAHMYTCGACAGKLTVCPICREPISKVVKVFAQQL